MHIFHLTPPLYSWCSTGKRTCVLVFCSTSLRRMNIALIPHSKFVAISDSFPHVYCSHALLTVSNLLVMLTHEWLYPWGNYRTTDCSRKARPLERKMHEWHFEWLSLSPVHQNVCEWLLKAVSSLEKCRIKYTTMTLGGGKENVLIKGFRLQASATSPNTFS